MNDAVKQCARLILAGALSACSSGGTITSGSVTSADLAVVENWTMVQRDLVRGAKTIRRCATLKSTYDIGDASEEREVAIEPWLYDLLFPAECEVRLLLDAPNVKFVPVRGGER